MDEDTWMDLAEEAGQLREAMAHRAPIEQAKGILMSHHACDADAAFAMLRTTSQQRNVKLWVLCLAVIEATTTVPADLHPAPDAALAAARELLASASA